MNEKTYGEIIVRTDFNPSDNSLVSQIKQKTADLINLINQLAIDEKKKTTDDGNFEVIRLSESAISHYEIAAMLAVKAATA